VTGHLRHRSEQSRISAIKPPIEHRDVTTIMALLADIHDDVSEIRKLLEDDYGEEEEAPEDDR
jgi:hypothetical protein